MSVSSGTISQKIKISTAGNYTFAVRNNSSQTVKVSGFVIIKRERGASSLYEPAPLSLYGNSKLTKSKA